MDGVFSFFQKRAGVLRATVVTCLYAAVCMPIVVGAGFLFPFVFPKALFFEAVVEIGLVVYCALILVDRTALPRIAPMTVAVSLWVSVIALTTFTGVDPAYSFWSKAERMDGLFWYLHVLLFFLMLSTLVSKREHWIRFLQFNAVVSWIVGATALLSKFARPLVPLGDQTRLAGTFGNPAFLATYFLVMLFVQILLAASPEAGNKRKIWIIGAAFAFLMVFMSGTRGAYVGIIAGMFVTFFLLAVASHGAYRKAALAGFGTLVLVGLSLWIGAPVVGRVSPFLASRIYSIWEIPKPRLIVWQIGLDAFRERPVFGWGMEGFLYAFDKYFIPDLHTYEMSLFDRPHNKVIDLATSQGIVGLATYLGIFATLVVLAWKKLFAKSAHKSEVRELAIFSGLGVAYFVQDLVLFEMPSSAVMLFVVFALGYWLLGRNEDGIKSGNPVPGGKPAPTYPAWLWYCFAAAITVSFWVGIAVPMQAGLLVVKSAFSLTPQAAPETAIAQSRDYYDRARSLDTYLNKEVDMAVDRRLADFSSTNPSVALLDSYKNFAQDIAVNLQQDMDAHPLDYDLALEYGTALFELRQRSSVMGVASTTADMALQHAISLGPKREDAYQFLFLLSMQQGNKEAADRYSTVLLGLNDKLGLFWFYRAEYEARWGTHATTYEALAEARRRGFDVNSDFAQWNQLINSLQLGGKHQDVIAQIRAFIATPGIPSDYIVQAYIRLIQVYRGAGDDANATLVVNELMSHMATSDQPALLQFLRDRKLVP